MPELPEVETVCRSLSPRCRDGNRPPRGPRCALVAPAMPAAFGAAVSGRTIAGLGRRGKYLLLGLDGGQTLVMHLRMTGNLVLVKEGEARSIRRAAAV